MKKSLKYLVLAALCVSTVNATDSSEHHNKTFVNPRAHGTNLAFWYGAGIPEVIVRKDKDKFGGTFFATGFYQHGEMDAEYWTPAGKNNFILNDSVFMNYTSSILTFANADNKITFDPEQEAYGVTLAYDQRLDSILKGLFFNVQLPIVHVENELNMKVAGTDTDYIYNFFKGQPNKTDVKRYMAGTTVFHSVEALKQGLIGGDVSTTGIADIDVRLGYNFINKPKYHVGLAAGLTIPTGTDVEGVDLNQAVVGNGQHWALGADLNADARIWGTVEHNFIMYAHLKYRYLFEAGETRILGITESGFGQWGFGLYNPLTIGTTNGAASALDIVPAANVLSHEVDVTPGSEFDGIVALAYNNGGFNANLGYNLYIREAEDVDFKGVNPFATGKEYSFISGGDSSAVTLTALTASNLDVSVAETPSQVTHKIFGGLAWTFKNWSTPVNVGVGGHYEFADQDEAYETWGLNARLGIGF